MTRVTIRPAPVRDGRPLGDVAHPALAATTRCLPRHAVVLCTAALLLLQAIATSQQASALSAPAPAVRLEIFPEQLHLPHRYASAQLLVTAVHPDGKRVDVTRYVAWESSGDAVEIDERGRVRAVAPDAGRATITASFAGARATSELTLPDDKTFEPGFTEHVLPAMTRLGCNTGTCHGSAEGQNGFQLSLRGYDAIADHRALTDDLAGRRFDPAVPDQSLFLLKPIGAVPHEGGKLLDRSEPVYALIRDWVASGAAIEAEPIRVVDLEITPHDPTLKDTGSEQQFAVHATFSDGSVRDVTAEAFVESASIEVVDIDDDGLVKALRRGEAAILARYQGRFASTRLFVMGDRDGFEWQPQPQLSWIDALVDARLEAIQSLPSPTCTDAEFLRRVHLDLTGLLPTPDDVETFLLDGRDAAVKRREVVDRLLGSTAFVEHWTNRWADLLQVNAKFLSPEGAARMRRWIRTQVASNRRYDAFVRDLIAATGSTFDNPPTAFHKIHREPDLAMEATTQLFLGTRFNCNKCHDHPFEKWTQRQHWEMAAVFADVVRADVDGRPRMPRPIDAPPGTKAPTHEEVIGDGGTATADRAPTVTDPNGRSYRPAFPYAHDGELPPADAATHRQRLAAWLTAPQNPLFATSYVNRVWSYLLGRGLIEPVDDIRAGNPPSHPELLERLTAEFVATGFDVRALIRTICNSATYQRSVVANEWNEDDTTHFARAIPRRLPAEVLFDAVHQAAGSEAKLPGQRPGTRARDLTDPNSKSTGGFLDLFGRPPRESVCECEREDGLSLGQALSLVNGPTIADAIQDPDNELSELARYERDPNQIVRELWLRFLSRPPSDDELTRFSATLDPTAAATLDALPPDQRQRYDADRASWEASIRIADWQPLTIGSVRTHSGAPFDRLEDGSVRATGAVPDKDVYTVTGITDVWPITGIRLEAIPDPANPSAGSGRASSGNFVLGHLRADLVALGDVTRSRPLPLTHATADFHQQNYPPAGVLTPAPDGWALHPHADQPHTLVVETGAEGMDTAPPTGGHLLVLHLDFPYGSQHVLGRFRLSVTSSERPVRESALPAEVRAALKVPSAERTDEQAAALHRHYLTVAPQWRDALRLPATQDLAWGLANGVGFLFY